MKPGDTVDDFELPDETGTPRRLSTLLGRGPVVLFFYPMAASTGCTREACHFRDLAAEFAAADAQPVGISSDGTAAQQRFASAHSLGYPLLSDEDNRVAKEFGVHRRFLPGGLRTRRMTVVIGQDRQIVDIVSGEMQFERHADEALEIVRRHRAVA
jgi:peroxiredoxin Q/BCP